MAVNLPPLGELLPVPGVEVGTACAGIKQKVRDDLTVLLLAEGSTVAGVFTRNAFRAAPVQLAEAAIARGGVRALVINSGNANAATGEPGLADARAITAALEAKAGLPTGSTMPFSTGVIGVRLPVERIVTALDTALSRARPGAWPEAAHAIMTTDTGPKALSRRANVAGVEVTLTGIAKGAGMIKPDMATMLGYIATDAAVSAECLAALTRQVADASFNRITIDGDTSTNDSFVVCASGAAANRPLTSPASPGYAEFAAALEAVAVELAQRIIRDAEGATKFVTVRVQGGATPAECLQVAYTIAESPLIKTAVFAGDPNWGRFCMAIGRAGLPALDTTRVNLYLDDVCVARGGLMSEEYREAMGAAVMARDEFEVRVELGRGTAEQVVWTSDLSYDYVKINAEYRT
ncbi:MAG: bifunctional glutamate N-acetyltransferase/amino-acid acetyltransferase ArgJ [Pseudomonadales bacterium]|nr:bifunctional glutamate N-acetyltransferase/amino-acid acetyltransferase ArgJ [Pseudomonadales bacterium]